jgi:hypothetical protein
LDTESGKVEFEKSFVCIQFGDAIQLIKELIKPMKETRGVLETVCKLFDKVENLINRQHFVITTELIEHMIDMAIKITKSLELGYLESNIQRIKTEFKTHVACDLAPKN